MCLVFSPAPPPSASVGPHMPSSSSGETIARVYNAGLTSDNLQRPLTGETVWNAFYLHALLLDRERRSEQLQIPHSGNHSNRFLAVLGARNVRMAGIGQTQWAHACDECEKIISPKTPSAQLSTFFHALCSMFLDTYTGLSTTHRMCHGRCHDWAPTMQCGSLCCTSRLTPGPLLSWTSQARPSVRCQWMSTSNKR